MSCIKKNQYKIFLIFKYKWGGSQQHSYHPKPIIRKDLAPFGVQIRTDWITMLITLESKLFIYLFKK